MNERDFEKISDISKCIKDLIQDRSKAESILIWKAWKDTVGEIIFSKTTIRSLNEERLCVEVHDEQWRKVLLEMKLDLIHKINEWIGKEIIRDIIFL